MSPSPEIWNKILKDSVEKDDPLWKEYLDKAAVFDVHMVDEWNKTVDVCLVYVALFISVLTTFIGRTTQFKRNPADITNDLLFALVVQSDNISIPPVDPRSYFDQSKAEYDTAVTQNALLYVSLSLCIVVSVIALAAKLWLLSYSREAFSVGSPYDRAMKRQEAYNGALVWRMWGVINMLPVILLIALALFGFYVYTSVWAVQESIGNTIGALLCVGAMCLGGATVSAAFVSGCPFSSPFSIAMRGGYEILQMLPKRILCGCPSSSKSSKRLRHLWIGTLAFLWVASDAVVAYATLIFGTWFSMFFFPPTIIIPITYSALQKAVHKPQKYKISYLAALLFLFVSLSMISAFFFKYPIFIPLHIIGVLGVVSACWMFSKMSKSMVDTGEIDAIAWLLITTPPQYPATFFKKAAQMTADGSNGRDYRPRLLKSLIPLLSPLITSHHAPEHLSSDAHSPQCDDDVLISRLRTSPSFRDDDMVSINEDPHLKNLEIYIACLARLSEFTDHEGTFGCLREDAKQHPKLEHALIGRLVELAKPQCHSLIGLRSAATKVLNNFKLDMEGNPLNPTTVLGSVATVSRNAATYDSGLNSNEEVKSDIRDEEIEA